MPALAHGPTFFGAPPPPSTLEAYAALLAARNGGRPDALRFDRREARLASLDASDAPYSRPVDAAALRRNYRRFDPRGLDPELIALLAFVKINAAEAYGVEVAEAVRGDRRGDGSLAGRLEGSLLAEESFHTRILLGVCGCFEGVDFARAAPPPIALRAFLEIIPRLPGGMFHALVLGSELAGVYLFDWMLRRLRTLFPNDPAVRESFERRLLEVLIDEVGHVTFNRILLGRAGAWLARPLGAAVLHTLPAHVPELAALGFSRWDLRDFYAFDVSRLPREVREQAFVA